MPRLFTTALTLASLTLAVTAANAQDFTAAQRAACKADFQTFCKGVAPGGGRVLACLGKNDSKLSAACKKVVADSRK